MELSSRRFRGPFARWPRVADAVLAAVLFAVTAFVTDGPNDSLVIRPIGEVPDTVLAIFAVAAAGIHLRRRYPIEVVGVAVVGWALLLPARAEYDLGLITIVALYSMGRYAVRGWRVRAGLAAVIVLLIVERLIQSGPWDETGVGVAVMYLAWYVGRSIRLRGERAVLQRRQRADEARRIVAEERTHIARELHDVVAHQVSMMTVQAGAAQAVAATDPEGARRAMAAVEQAGRQALDELRHLLGVLRPETERDGGGPQPGLADLPRLIAQVDAAGLDIRVDDGLRTPLPTRIQLSAYRIIQEALTNVLKHGGPGTRTEVRLREDGPDITIEVVDHAPGPARPPAAGHGIIGMRERATLLGGSLETGPRPEGGFQVLARLPLANEPPAKDPPTNEPPTKDTPTNEPPTKDIPTNEPPARDLPTNEPPTKDAPANEPPTKDTPANEPPAWNHPADAPTAEHHPAKTPRPKEAPAGGPPVAERLTRAGEPP